LLWSYNSAKDTVLHPLFDKVFSFISKPAFPVTTKLHGYSVSMPSDYSYPFVSRNHASFNSPYLELVFQTFRVKKRRLNIVDVGGAIGDTFFFIMSNIPESVSKIYCVEGSPYFLPYLQKNLSQYQEGVVVDALLSDSDELIPELILHHGSSAMAAGKTKTKAVSMDRLLKHTIADIPDVIKIDVDGYDGKVLKGATTILQQFQPAVIFEYHPALIIKSSNELMQPLKSSNELMQPFEILANTGYQLLLWYDKFGHFSHTTGVDDKLLFQKTATDCLKEKNKTDWHYDVIGLSDVSAYDIDSLKTCSFASNKKSPY
jgi:FkbM family methyltransferase